MANEIKALNIGGTTYTIQPDYALKAGEADKVAWSNVETPPEKFPNPYVLKLKDISNALVEYDGSGDADLTTGVNYATRAGSAVTVDNLSNALKCGTKSFNGSEEVTITAEDLGLAAALKYHGVTTTELTDGATTNPIKINNADHTATTGCVVINSTGAEFAFDGAKWQLLGDANSYKTKQTAKSDPTASGSATAFIDTIFQDTNGVITVTKKNVPDASITSKGLVTTEAQSFAGAKTFTNNVVITGTCKASEGFFEDSDERLKTFGEPVKVDLDKLSKLTKAYFVYNSNPEKNQLGVSAQEIQEIYPEIVNTDENGFLSVDYAKLSVIALTAVDELNNRLNSIEERLTRLEK